MTRRKFDPIAKAAWRKALDERQAGHEPLLQLLPIGVAIASDAHAADELAIRTAIEEALASLSVKGQKTTQAPLSTSPDGRRERSRPLPWLLQ